MYLNFMFLDGIPFELSRNTMKTHTHTHIYAHKDSDEYFIVAFCKNATLIISIMISDLDLKVNFR